MSRASPTVGDNSGNGQLRNYIERIERLQEERKSIAGDIADLFKEMVSDGHDKEAAKTVLKIRSTDNGLETWTVRSAVVDTYLAALGMLPEVEPRAPAHAHVENIELSGAGSLDPKLVETIAKAVQTKAGTAALLAAVDIMIEREEAHDPETGELEPAGFIASLTEDQKAAALAYRGDDTHGQESPVPEPLQEQAKPDAGTPPPASGTLTDADVPAFLRKDEPNARCMKQGDCKFARHPHKITCSDCGTAWAISQRKRGRAE